MCGIAGCVKQGGGTPSKALLKAMADAIAHRGPDDEGYFFAPGAGLAHRRLSIIDLERGHQPMTTGGGRYTIVYNGEVYNFKQLRGELELAGEVFVTGSDTEVILKAFRVWGMDCFSRFRGMFALGVWDDQEKRLTLARDHFGIKPLYYIDLGGELIFASEIKALFCSGNVKRDLDPLTLAGFLSFNNILGAQSLWAGVKRLLPGEILVWQEGGIKTSRYFDISRLEVEKSPATLDEAAEQFEALLSESVKESLVSDVPLGSYLSGGLDSGAISSLAVKWSGGPVPTFTGYFEGYEGGWFDERRGSSAVSEHLNTANRAVPISWDDFDSRMETVSYHLDEPTLGSGSVPHYVLARSASEDVKVVLTGHGGDELFAGYPVFKAARFRDMGFGLESAKLLLSGGLDEKIRMLYFLLGGVWDRALSKGQFRMFGAGRLREIATGSLMGDIEKAGGPGALFDSVKPFEPATGVDGLTRWYIATYLPTLLTQEDKVSMAHGLESRVPMLNEPIARLALSLSGSVKLYNGRLKTVSREGMRGILPEVSYRLPKRGFPTPIVQWLRGPAGEGWERKWEARLPNQLAEYIDPAEAQKEFSTFRRFGAGKLPNAYAVAHRLVSLETLRGCVERLCAVKAVDETAAWQKPELPGSFVVE